MYEALISKLQTNQNKCFGYPIFLFLKYFTKMKKYITVLVLFYSVLFTAQTDNQTFTFDAVNLEIPNAPAFVLLDAAPTTIQRPNSSRALGISLIQDIANDGILDDISVEVTPFWMTRSLKRSALSFYGIDKNLKQYPFSKLKLASISAAYVKSPDSIINISMGARATVFELKRKSDIIDYYDTYTEIEKLTTKILDFQDEYEETHPEPDCENDGTDSNCTKQWEVYNNGLINFLQEKIKERAGKYGYTSKMQEIINRKPAFALDVAVAYNQRFSEDHFNDNGFGRFGVWGTAAASVFLDQSKFNYLNIYGFVRYLKGERQTFAMVDNNYNAIDLGIKAELEFKKLVVGYEYINRSGDLESYRSAGNIKYQAFENIFLTGSFGNNFSGQDDLITLFGVQWGLNGVSQLLGI